MARTGNAKALATVLGAAAVLAVALTALLAVQPADAAGRFKVVTKTFSSAQQITIPEFGAAAPYPSERNAAGFERGKILDANLTLKNFSHTVPADVDVMLSHKGVNRTVMSDAGAGFPVGNVTLKLDDEAPSPLPSGAPLAGGSFRPANYDNRVFDPGPFDGFEAPAPAQSGLSALSGFDGGDPNGPWRLWVTDDSSFDGGQFAGGWSVTIKARVLR